MGNKHTYSSSVVEMANLWIQTYLLMERHKQRYGSKIYFMNYDNLVTQTEKEIKSLIYWLGWDYDSKYLNPNLDPTTINSHRKKQTLNITKDDLYSWKNYRELLNPAIEIFNRNIKFKSLFSN
tara:strand:+ start:124 stop:492 length:369 start_codon:yes stop_codon:yes gene_type:complete